MSLSVFLSCVEFCAVDVTLTVVCVVVEHICMLHVTEVLNVRSEEEHTDTYSMLHVTEVLHVRIEEEHADTYTYMMR